MCLPSTTSITCVVLVLCVLAPLRCGVMVYTIPFAHCTLLLLPVIDCACFCLRGMDDSCQTYLWFPANSTIGMILKKNFQVSKYLGPYLTCQRLYCSGKASGLRHHTRARFGWDYRIPGYGLNGVLNVR